MKSFEEHLRGAKHITVRIKSGLLRVFLGKWLSCVPSTAFPMMKICSST